MNNKSTLTRLYLILVFISGLSSVVYMVALPAAQEGIPSLTPIYKGAGILILLVTGCILIAALIGISNSHWSPARFQRGLDRWMEILTTRRVFSWIILGCLGLALITANFLIQISQVEIPQALLLLTLIQPLMYWGLSLLLLTIPLIILLGNKGSVFSPEVLRSLVIFLGLLIIILIITQSGFGYQQSSAEGGNFRPLTYPLVGYQVVFSLLGLGSYLVVDSWLEKRMGEKYRKYCWLVDGLFIILGAFLLWQSVPVEQNAFVDIPRPPNLENYPGLDAIFYDRSAQNFLATGNMGSYLTDDIKSTIARRPLLILLYAGLHRLAGLGIEDILPYQLALFTAFPVLIYLFTKKISNRAAGLLTALLTIIRGWNGLRLGSEVTGTNLQMQMSDYPAAIGVILFLYLGLIWLMDRPQGYVIPLLMGGALGTTMLIRQEVGGLILATGLVGLVILKKEPIKLVRGGLAIILGLLIVISPWMIRNYQVNGKAFLDAPWSIGLFRQTYKEIKSGSNGAELNHVAEVPDLGQIEASTAHQSVPVHPSETRAGDVILGIGSDDPGPGGKSNQKVALIANHLFSNTLQSVLYLPNRAVMLDVEFLTKAINSDLKREYGGFFYSLESYLQQAPYWRWDWNGEVINRSLVPLGIILVVLAIGLAKVWHDQDWVLFLPILAFLIQIGAYTLIRRSGGRYLLEVDWISSMFFSIGLIQLSTWMGIRNTLPARLQRTLPLGRTGLKNNPPGKLILYLVITCGFFLVGTAPIAAEVLADNPYTTEVLDQKLTSALYDPGFPWTSPEKSQIKDLLESGGEAQFGRALYPRYFLPGEEIRDTVEFYFNNSTTFYISGTIFDYVVLPGEQPANFPHGADVLVIGCPKLEVIPSKDVCIHCQDGGLDATAVVIYDQDGKVVDALWREGGFDLQPAGCLLKDR